MTGKEIIDLIQEHGLEDYEVKAVFTDGYNPFPIIKSLDIFGIADIGVSDQVFYLDGFLNE